MKQVNYILTLIILLLFNSCTERNSYLMDLNSKPEFLIRSMDGSDTTFKTDIYDSLRLSNEVFSFGFKLVDEELVLSKQEIVYEYKSGYGEFIIDDDSHVISYHPTMTGLHEVVINVSDNYKETAFAQFKLYVYDNLPPVPIVTFMELPKNNYRINASQSYDPDGEIINYHFDYGVKTIDYDKPIVDVWTDHLVQNGGVKVILTDDKGAKSDPVFFKLETN